MSTIIKSPGPIGPQVPRSIFIAGGISNCPDWQEAVSEKIALNVEDCVIYNPRREDFDMTAYEEVSRQQIQWEHLRIKSSNVMLFWFPEETLCPITLFEYGVAIGTRQVGSVMCGTHPNYARRFDLIEQTRLALGMPIYDNLDALVDETIILLNSLPKSY